MNSHLCGFTTIESASPSPQNGLAGLGAWRRPPHRLHRRAARCSRRPQIPAISPTGSTLVVDVVPIVATTARGRMPAARSSAIASWRASVRSWKLSSQAFAAAARCPSPSRIDGLVHRRMRVLGAVDANAEPARPASPSSRTPGTATSRAAASAWSVDIDAVS